MIVRYARRHLWAADTRETSWREEWRSGQPVEPELFHAALHQQHGMMITLEIQRFLDFRCEGQLNRHSPYHTKYCAQPSVIRNAIHPRGEYRSVTPGASSTHLQAGRHAPSPSGRAIERPRCRASRQAHLPQPLSGKWVNGGAINTVSEPVVRRPACWRRFLFVYAGHGSILPRRSRCGD